MKNRILFLGGLCLVLALGLIFIGCDDGPVDHPNFDGVGITVVRGGTVEDATGTSNNNFLVTWSAVEGALSYSVVFRPVDKVYFAFVGQAQNARKYSKNAAGVFEDDDNDDLDAWSAVVDMNGTFPNNTVGQFGVAVIPLRYDRNPVIIWDDVEYLVP